jgi:hypothetical protein
METFTLDTPDYQIRQELTGGETLLWAGQPKQGIVFRSSDAFMIPFSLLWGGFAVFWEISAISILFFSDKRPPFPFALIFPLFGVPFVLIGLYFIFGRFIVDAKRRAGTYYGVTDRRIIIVSGAVRRKVKTINLRTISDLSLNERASSMGTITFGPSNPMSWWFGGMPWPGMPQPVPCFELIQDAKSVYEIIRNAYSKV